jgi:recombination protein RecT
MECEHRSLLASFMGVAQLGLSPIRALGQAYLVPYWNSKKRIREAQLIVGYRGYVTLARRSGDLANVMTQVVRPGERFDIEYGTSPRCVHVPSLSADMTEDIIGAYCTFFYRDVYDERDRVVKIPPTFEFMNRAEIEKIRARSKAADSGPWISDYNEMAKKTVIRRHIKLASLSVEDKLYTAAAADEMADLGNSQADLFLSDYDAAIEVGQGQGQEPDKNGGEAEVAARKRRNVEAFDNFLRSRDALDNPTMQRYLDFCAKRYEMTVSDFKAEIAPDDYQEFFERYSKKAAQWAEEKKPKFEPKFQLTDQDEGLEGEDLYQSDAWNELTALQSKYPDLYKKLIADARFTLKTERSVKMAIDKINAAIDEADDGQRQNDEMPES